MKKSIFFIMGVTTLLFASDSAVMNYLKNNIYTYEANSYYKRNADEINRNFSFALSKYKNNTKENKEKVRYLLGEFYQESNALYEDSPDHRRYLSRRAVLFCTIALFSSASKYETFLFYAKQSLRDGVNKQFESLLVKQYIAIHILQLYMLKKNGGRESLIKHEKNKLLDMVKTIKMDDYEKSEQIVIKKESISMINKI